MKKGKNLFANQIEFVFSEKKETTKKASHAVGGGEGTRTAEMKPLGANQSAWKKEFLRGDVKKKKKGTSSWLKEINEVKPKNCSI